MTIYPRLSVSDLSVRAEPVEGLRANGLLNNPGLHLPDSLLAGSYNNEHPDPFDRMLAAQSEIEKAQLVTCDAAFAGFGTAVLW